MVQNNPIGFTGTEGGGKKSAFSILKDSAINVGATVAVGATAGGAIGKVASLTPYKPTEAALDFQYNDIFQKAVMSDETPSFLKKQGGAVVDTIKDAKGVFKNIEDVGAKAQEAIGLRNLVSKATDEAFSGDELKKQIKEFLTKTANDIPDDAFTKENVLKKLESCIEGCKNSIEKEGERFENLGETFLAKVKALKSKDISEIAEAGAKHLRKRAIIGTGIAIGIMGGLVLNILKTYGVIGKKPASNGQMTPSAQQFQQPINTHQA